MFVVYIYVEEGDYDGQSFVAGPYTTEADAHACASGLEEFGQVEVMPTYPVASQLMKSLREAKS